MSENPDRIGMRPRILIAIAAAVVAAVVIIAIVFAVASQPNRTPGAGPSPDPAISGTPTSLEGTGATGTPVPIDSPIPVDGDPEVPAGVTISLGQLTAVEGEPQGAGELAGPAVRAVVTIVNSSDRTIDLTAVVVNLYYGSDNRPAVPVSGPDAYNLPVEVGPGQTVEGAYVFTVPLEGRDLVTIVVDRGAGTEPIAFQGPAPR